MEELRDFITNNVNISEMELKEILSNFRQIELEKGRFLVKRGHLVQSYYFVATGGLRIYFDKDEKQITAWIALDNNFFTELQSLKSGKSSEFFIQAIERSTVYTIDAQKMHQLYDKFPIWQRFGRMVWEDAFIKVINGILSHQTLSAEERYLEILDHSDLLQKIPLKQLASYLGITETSLSRLRKNIK